jgi:hypothetical protein
MVENRDRFVLLRKDKGVSLPEHEWNEVKGFFEQIIREDE